MRKRQLHSYAPLIRALMEKQFSGDRPQVPKSCHFPASWNAATKKLWLSDFGIRKAIKNPWHTGDQKLQTWFHYDLALWFFEPHGTSLRSSPFGSASLAASMVHCQELVESNRSFPSPTHNSVGCVGFSPLVKSFTGWPATVWKAASVCPDKMSLMDMFQCWKYREIIHGHN